MGIRGLKITPYHPQTDGMVERFNQMMKVRRTWQHGMASGTKLCHLSLASTEQHQMQQRRQIQTPLKVFKERWTDPETRPQNVVQYVEELTARFEKLRETAEENECKQKARYKHHYDQKSVERKFQVGDMVLLRTPPMQHGMYAEWLVHI